MLGPPQVKQVDHALNIARRKVQALLYYLAVNRELQQRATLATLLWPESDQQSAAGSLRRHLSELNRLLGPGWLDTEQDAVRLARRTDLWVDVAEFQRLLATCREHGHLVDAVCERCIAPLTAAADLYRDDLLAGFSLPDTPDFDDWQLFQREELRFALATALDRLVEAHQRQETIGEAIPIARRRLSLDPLHEPAHRQLMQLYAASGQETAALRQYERCVQILQTELDAPPAPETTALYEQIRLGRFVAAHATVPAKREPPQTTRHNLTAPTTPLIGRTTECKELIKLIADPTQRLITILGPGGIGKTRLALTIAQQVVENLALDTFMVYLARLSDPSTIIPTIADALNFQFQTDGRTNKAQLFAYLAPKQLYLVLDNIEHLLDGVHLVQELLEQCPQVRLLITSRERLKLTGETVYTLQSLDFPTWETPQELQRYDAAQLFFETARRVRPNVVFQTAEMQYIARICRMVGGMPLGIILAATWVEHLAPATIATELTRGFDLLETELRDLPERQRSMRTILDYSWQRLTVREQDVFMRLATFQGGFTRAAAQAVAGATLPILVHLVDKSFLQSIAGERYEIHELLRQYAGQQLKKVEALTETQRIHANYYLDLLHNAEERLAGTEQLPVIHQIEADFENIRAAWQWAVMQDEYRLIDGALEGLFRWFWLRCGRQQEGLALLNMAHQRLTPDGSKEMRSLWGGLPCAWLNSRGRGSWSQLRYETGQSGHCVLPKNKRTKPKLPSAIG
ncbi:MAG: BTAD domain-containing putative transcriptional regulator [Caldilineaceae bacterium]